MTDYARAESLAKRYRTVESAEYDDLVQEAMIAVWLEESPDARDRAAYITTVMKNRMTSVVAGRVPMFGNKNDHPVYEPLRQAARWLGGDDGEMLLAEFPDETEIPIDRSAEVLAAIETLSKEDRIQVEARFWHGKTTAQISAETGVAPRTLEYRWANRIKPALRRALGSVTKP